jgi:hypothetical protein
MNQSEFNKQERFNALIQETVTKGLTYKFILDESKRNKWNINARQAEEIAAQLNINTVKVLFYALELNILNVDNKTKKALQKQLKNKEQYH